LLALLDDIATVLDDVAVLTKIAAKKTAGVLGDDLALNAEQVSGVRAERELPVVWAVAKGSAVNKVILVPVALGLGAFLPMLITPLLMLGGAYLCFEGFEKIAEKLLHPKLAEKEAEAVLAAFRDESIDLATFEHEKIKGAIRTDFVLSAEIIVISMGAVQAASFAIQASVVASIAVMMTIGVYGFVALIVKLDDIGMYMVENSSESQRLKRKFGTLLADSTPYLMKTLAIVGTVAMFLVGGGILAHGIPGLEPFIYQAVEVVGSLSVVGTLLASIAPFMANFIVGLVSGGLLVLIVTSLQKLVPGKSAPH
jgi:predicted DNA repair protein MutK